MNGGTYCHLCGSTVKENNDSCLVLWKYNCTCQQAADNAGLQLPGGRTCLRSFIRCLQLRGVRSPAAACPGFYYLVLDRFLLCVQVWDYCSKMLNFPTTAQLLILFSGGRKPRYRDSVVIIQWRWFSVRISLNYVKNRHIYFEKRIFR